MMNKLLTILITISSLLLSATLPAVEFDEVRDFEDVFVISAQAPGRDRVEVSWKIEDEYYLYNNKFLRFTSASDGVVLGEPRVPKGEIEFDELLGEDVEKYHGSLTVTIPLVSVAPGVKAVQLKVRSQGCWETVLCYPPTEQILLVSLPPDLAAAGPLAGLLEDPLAGLTGMGEADSVFGLSNEQALPPEQAFVYESIGESADTALVRFTVQPGYYLYLDKFEFRIIGDDGFVIREVALPDGVIKDDPEFGSVLVYYGQIEIPVKFNRPAGTAVKITLEADFQGCRDGDICYPPMSRAVTFEMPAAAVAIGKPPTETRLASTADTDVTVPVVVPVSEQDRLAFYLTDKPARAIFAFFIAGLLLAFTPCVFPMVPILSGIIAGQGKSLTAMKAFWLSLVYVLAMAVTYTFAGVLAGLFGQNLQAAFQNPWIISGFVLIFIALAFSMFGFFELQLPGRLQTRLTEASNRQQGGQLWGVAVMGFLSALIVGPCVAPPLMAADGCALDPVWRIGRQTGTPGWRLDGCGKSRVWRGYAGGGYLDAGADSVRWFDHVVVGGAGHCMWNLPGRDGADRGRGFGLEAIVEVPGHRVAGAGFPGNCRRRCWWRLLVETAGAFCCTGRYGFCRRTGRIPANQIITGPGTGVGAGGFKRRRRHAGFLCRLVC